MARGGNINRHITLDSEWFRLKPGTLTADQKITQLFEQLRDSVYRYLMVLTGNPAEAEEITQEAFLRLCKCLQNGQAITHVRSWIFRVGHNLAIDRNMNGRIIVLVESSSWDELCEFRHDPNPNPEQTVLIKERFQRLEMVLRGLSAIQRNCLVLRAEGFRYEQIAEILDISVTNVAQSLRRGIKKLMEKTYD